MLTELVGDAVFSGGQEKERMGCLLDDLRAFGTKADLWMIAAQDADERYKTAIKVAEFFTKNCIALDGARAALRHAVLSPNLTGRTKERVSKSKRARTGLLATVD